MAETALLVAVVALAAVMALRAVGSSGGDKLDQAGKGIHRAPTSDGAGGSGGGGSDGGSGGTGGSGGSGSVGGGGSGGDPGASSTTSAVPTTAPPPTTTTAAVSTTTTPPDPATVALDDGRGVRVGSSRWQASADLALEVDGGAGPLSGTVTVVVRTQRANGQWSSQTIEVAVEDGGATISTGPYARTGGSRIVAVEYEVIDVELDGGRGWDGDRPSISIDRPG